MRDACEALFLQRDDGFPLACVGESHYQTALELACGGDRTVDGVDLQVTAVLVLENSNPYDREAVRVDVHGRTVGYLSRADARAFRRLAEEYGVSEELSCRGRIRGGWDRGAEDVGNFGIYLDLALYDRRVRET